MLNENKYFVSRQCYCFTDKPWCVEIAIGGIDYANPDALTEKYPGEMQEYKSATDAVEAAIKIHKQWKKDSPSKNPRIDVGCTFGYTMPFTDNKTYKALRQWAKNIDK